MTSSRPIIVWFRNALRISDQTALYLASQQQEPLILLYINDTQRPIKQGEASQWWVRKSIIALQNSLREKYQAKLILRQGDPKTIFSELLKKTKARAIYWDRVFEPDLLARDKALESEWHKSGVESFPQNNFLLFSPWEYKNRQNMPWKVFSPFWKTLQTLTLRECYPSPKRLKTYTPIDTLSIDDLYPLPHIPWYQAFDKYWTPGEAGAKKTLSDFLKNKLSHYEHGRDRPDQDYTSRLSPHLHFGEISPVQIWHAAQQFKQAEKFLSEIAWREFSYHLLHHFPELPNKPFRKEFIHFPWKNDDKILKAWQKGETGYPLVDAGMKELWQTGYMHNRVRMICASFLVKHLLIPWQVGEAWFWNTLLDADLANNSASWQWVAGSGADAAPYFRIFNPILQGEKFDPEGDYIKKWVPALRKMPNKFCHAPWEAPLEVLKNADCELGKDYPYPLIEHDFARKRALEAYKRIKK